MFEISLRPHGTATSTRVHASGDMDVFGADELRQALRRYGVQGVRGVRIEVDLSDVTWVNGSALRHLAATREGLFLTLGVHIDLVEWSAAVQQMCARTRLEGALSHALAA
jgi:anti-anti-sigma factor